MTGWLDAVILYPPAGPACAQEHKLFEWEICINKLICLFLQKYDNMRHDLLIELLEEGDKVSLYSPRFSGEEYTEFEKFLLD